MEPAKRTLRRWFMAMVYQWARWVRAGILMTGLAGSAVAARAQVPAGNASAPGVPSTLPTLYVLPLTNGGGLTQAPDGSTLAVQFRAGLKDFLESKSAGRFQVKVHPGRQKLPVAALFVEGDLSHARSNDLSGGPYGCTLRLFRNGNPPLLRGQLSGYASTFRWLTSNIPNDRRVDKEGMLGELGNRLLAQVNRELGPSPLVEQALRFHDLVEKNAGRHGLQVGILSAEARRQQRTRGVTPAGPGAPAAATGAAVAPPAGPARPPAVPAKTGSGTTHTKVGQVVTGSCPVSSHFYFEIKAPGPQEVHIVELNALGNPRLMAVNGQENQMVLEGGKAAYLPVGLGMPSGNRSGVRRFVVLYRTKPAPEAAPAEPTTSQEKAPARHAPRLAQWVPGAAQFWPAAYPLQMATDVPAAGSAVSSAEEENALPVRVLEFVAERLEFSRTAEEEQTESLLRSVEADQDNAWGARRVDVTVLGKGAVKPAPSPARPSGKPAAPAPKKGPAASVTPNRTP